MQLRYEDFLLKNYQYFQKIHLPPKYENSRANNTCFVSWIHLHTSKNMMNLVKTQGLHASCKPHANAGCNSHFRTVALSFSWTLVCWYVLLNTLLLSPNTEQQRMIYDVLKQLLVSSCYAYNWCSDSIVKIIQVVTQKASLKANFWSAMCSMLKKVISENLFF